MKIIKYTSEYQDQVGELFLETDPEESRKWNKQTAIKYLQNDVQLSPGYCLIALFESEMIAAIFCRVDPYYKSNLLFIDEIMVKKQWRRRRVATKLLDHILKHIKHQNFQGIYLLTQNKNDYVYNWYQKMGFKPTGWIEMEVDLNKIEIK